MAKVKSRLDIGLLLVKVINSINKIIKKINSDSFVPVGTINMYAGASAPDGWLMCNGQSISRKRYSELFAVIGTTYGSDSSDTFKLPDLKDRFNVGAGNLYELGDEGGDTTTSSSGSGDTGSAGGGNTGSTAININQMPSHNHGLDYSIESFDLRTTPGGYWTGNNAMAYYYTASSQGKGEGHTHTLSDHTHSISSHTHDSIPPYLAVNYIIKADSGSPAIAGIAVAGVSVVGTEK